MLCKKVSQQRIAKTQKRHQAGQALMEFVLGLMIVISFFFFFLRMSGTFAIGNFIHYATFMSARAYMSSNTSQGEQQSNAEKVLQTMVAGRWSAIIKPDSSSAGSIKGGFVGAGPMAQDSMSLDYWNQGVTFAYTAKLNIYPWSREGQGIDLKLTSESWMPREQSAAECKTSMGKVVGALAAGVPGIQASDLELDNGC